MDRRSTIVSHDLPDISFASGGDTDAVEYMAFVGKSSDRSTSLPGRWCYVLECGAESTQECVSTIGQAFDIRFRQYLRASQSSLNSSPLIKRSPVVMNRYSGEPERMCVIPARKKDVVAKKPLAKIDSAGDQGYYNDMPGKMPPPAGKIFFL